MSTTTDARTGAKKSRHILSKDDHAVIQEKCKINPDTEDYAVVSRRGKGEWFRSIHVFSRQPTTPEINAYEQTASRVKFKGNKAEMEGSQINAARDLYDKLIARSYDVLVGLRLHAELDRQQSINTVPPLDKREAIRDFIAEVYSSARMAEAEGAEESIHGDTEED